MAPKSTYVICSSVCGGYLHDVMNGKMYIHAQPVQGASRCRHPTYLCVNIKVFSMRPILPCGESLFQRNSSP